MSSCLYRAGLYRVGAIAYFQRDANSTRGLEFLPVQEDISDGVAMTRWAVDHPFEDLDLFRNALLNTAEVCPAGERERTIGHLPGLEPASLGDPSFLTTHCVRYPYICGEMANG